MAGLLSRVLALFGREEAREPEYKTADAYTQLRRRLLTLDPATIGLSPSSTNRVWAVLMEIGYPDAVLTLAAISDGTVSLYFSSGGGMIGLGEHEGPRRASVALLAVAPEFLKYARPVKDCPLPTRGQTRFTFLTFDGVLAAEGGEDDLVNQRSPLSPLFYKAQDVITEARRAEEQGRAQ